MQDAILTQLVSMSRNLGDPINDYVILGEGNTSAQVDGDSFWVVITVLVLLPPPVFLVGNDLVRQDDFGPAQRRRMDVTGDEDNLNGIAREWVTRHNIFFTLATRYHIVDFPLFPAYATPVAANMGIVSS